MKAFLDKYKYILGLGFALAVVVIIAVVSAIVGKDATGNSGISCSAPETSAVTSTANLDTTTTPQTSVNSNAPPVTNVTDNSSQTASESDLLGTTYSERTVTTANSAPEAPTPTTAPVTSKASEKPITVTSTAATTTAKITAATTKATTKTTTKVTTKATTPKPDKKPTVQYEHSCTFTIDCRTILYNKDMLKKGLEKYVPDDGMIYSGTVGFNDGESVYGILRRICDENEIQMEASFTPAFNSYYVEGINNLYEFDCGQGSGWMYSVNGVFPNYSCSSYKPVNNDKIAFRYTCELGYDLGYSLKN